jgi:hypothetical protein
MHRVADIFSDKEESKGQIPWIAVCCMFLLLGERAAGTLLVVWLTARTILFFPRFEPPLMFSPPSLSYQCDLDLVSLPNSGFFIP